MNKKTYLDGYIRKETPGFRAQWVWQKVSDHDREDVKILWRKEQAMPEHMMDQRADQLCFIVREESTGDVVGVSTLYEQYNEQLESYFYYMRSFVGVNYRTGFITSNMVLDTIDILEAQYKQGDYLIGVILEIENPTIQQAVDVGVIKGSRLTYFGKNAKGAHCRVRYFEDAKLFIKKPVA